VLIGGPSFWFHELGGLPSPRQPLAGPLDVDVAIVGGGFTGLWTAYYLRRDAPELEVALLEREVCGYGASGRNGGWVCGELPGFHDARSRAAGAETVREVGRVCAAEEIDCGFRHGGMLLVATNGPQLADLRAAALRDGDAVLDPPALAARLRVAGALGGVFLPQYARASSRHASRAASPASSSGSAPASTRAPRCARSRPASRAPTRARSGPASSSGPPRATRPPSGASSARSCRRARR
jgi:hypothetical protein